MCGTGTEAGLSFTKELDIDDSISELILSNNLLYNLNLFSCVWCIKH